jgi:hypothetical protein
VFLGLGLVSSASAAPAGSGVTSNGFETNTAGWFNNDGTITQRPSGYANPGGYASGVSAAEGSYFAGLDRGPCSTVTDNPAGSAILCSGPYTDWGNYNGYTWNGPYTTQVDIYLDTAFAVAHPDTFNGDNFGGNLDLVNSWSDATQYGTRFDFTSAINSSVPNGSGNAQFLRDFGFNVATGNAEDGCAGFIITGQTVVNRDNANPHILGASQNPQCISTSGWYTFKQSFSSKDGYLDVLMQIFPKGSATAAASWDITGIDKDGTYGCSRYGWFSDQEIYGLPIDNAKITGGCATVPHVSKILPTGTTCQQYSAGTQAVVGPLLYTTKGNSMNSVAPGVFFYYTKVTGTKGDTVGITETNNGSPAASPIPIQQGQVVLYDANTCTVVKWNPTVNSDGTATGTLPSSGNFIIGVKYNASGLQGQKSPVPATVTYSFGATLKGSPVDAGATINLAPKH